MVGKEFGKSLSNRAVIGATWEFGSVIVQAVIQFAVMAILARLIQPEGFGLYAIVTTSIALITLLSEIGVGQSVVQKKEITDRFLHTSLILSIALGLMGTIVTCVAAPAIGRFFKQPEVVSMIRVASITLFINGYVTIANALLERELLYKKLAIINIVSYAFGYGCIGTILALSKIGAWAIVLATLSQTIIRAFMLLRMAKAKIVRVFSKHELKEILRFCTGVSIGRIFNNIAYYIDNLVVGRMMGPAPLGLYQMGFQIMDLPRRFLSGVIDRVMFSAFTRIQDDDVRMKSATKQSLEIANILLVPVTAIMIIVAPEALRTVLGEKWTGLIIPLQIMLLQIPLRASVRMGDMSGTAVGKVYTIGVLKMIYAGMIGIAAWAGVHWGLSGVAIAVNIAVFVNFILMVRFTLSYVRISFIEYLQTWIPGCLLGALVVLTALPGRLILRNIVGSDLFRLLAVMLFTVVIVVLAVWIRPRIMGKTALRLILDFETRTPRFQRVFNTLRVRSMDRRKIE